MSAGQGHPAVLLAVGGFSGSGKSTTAAALAPLFGATVLASDRLRKALYGVSPETRLPLAAYHPDVSAVVYGRLMSEAEACLRGGQAVIADAVFDRAEDRARIAAVAVRTGARFLGLWLRAPVASLRERVAARVGDASDATPDVAAAQAARHPQPVTDWETLDTDDSLEIVTAAAVSRVQAWYAAESQPRSMS